MENRTAAEMESVLEYLRTESNIYVKEGFQLGLSVQYCVPFNNLINMQSSERGEVIDLCPAVRAQIRCFAKPRCRIGILYIDQRRG